MTSVGLTRSSRRSSRLGVWVCALLGALVGVGACSGGSDSHRVIGSVDHGSNGSISVNEAGIAAVVQNGTLALTIPVSGQKDASGTLAISLILVDDSKTISTTSAPYDVSPGASAVLQATLPVPSDVKGQPDWAKYSVLIVDGVSSSLRVTTSLLRVVGPYELRLEGPSTIASGKAGSYRVVAERPTTKAPVSGIPVGLSLTTANQTATTLTGTTSATGEAIFPVTLTNAGSYALQATGTASGTTTTLADTVAVQAPDQKVLLTTDKPIYQPGQTIHLRTLALAPPADTPTASASAVFEVADGKGNEVFHQELTTDAYGVASADFVIGPIVNEGTFKATVAVGGTTTEKTVDVSHYVLPKFGVDVSVDKTWYSPGDPVAGSVDALYFFGKVVANADVVIEGYTLDVGETAFQQVVGKTDANGKMSFALTVPSTLAGLPLSQGNATAGVRVTVTDSAGQVVTKEAALTIAADAVRLTVVPESTTIVPGLPNRLEVFASDPLGAPIANAPVSLVIGATTLTATTDPYGHAEVTFTPDLAQDTFSVAATVTPPSGAPITRQLTFGAQTGDEHVIVRSDKSVYDVGDTVTVSVLASSTSVHAYVDWLNEGQAVDMRTVDLENGAGTFTMPLDASLLGSNRIDAYIVDDGGNVVRAGRTLFVRGDSSLNVTIQADKTTYTPGQSATLTFSVADSAGKPAVAALGVQVVDAAVFGLVDAQPGLLKSFFDLEDSYSNPTYEIDGPLVSLSNVLFDGTASTDPTANQAAQAEAEATFAAMGGSGVTGIHDASYPQVVADVKTLLTPYLAAEKTRIVSALELVVPAESAMLESQGCTASGYYCSSLGTDYGSALGARVARDLSVVDFWGNLFTTTSGTPDFIDLVSNGPDELPGTTDDLTIAIAATDVGVLDVGSKNGGAFDFPVEGPGEDAPGNAAAGGSFSMGGTAGVDTGQGGATTSPGGSDATPRVRQDFPETLYVNPEVITGADGTAQIQIPLADSITKWQVSALANTAGGKLGGGQGSMTVFQDFFVDASLPATLTRGDEVEFPIAVYNYLTTSQTVHLTLQAASWYTPAGATSIDVPLDAGEVTGVRFPVKVTQVGHQSLTVQAVGTKASDAVARPVTVVPDGKAFPEAHSGSLGATPVIESITFPATAIAGSSQLYVNLFPGYLSQLVQGMDSVLAVPNGCFEQTTSTTWPDVLAASYMQATKQGTPDAALKAESYINAGYQRLLTFEHPGGGFSWFGTQDPAPYLSVTALGVMEFSDMAKIHPVDAAMIARTKTWLIGQQAADGSWPADQSEFFSVQTSLSRNTAFVVWALASAGDTGPELARGLAYVKTALGTGTTDAYTLGLAAN
ncbi:MAG TPA: alpha-2-macroglobulin family protein, partial [Polyangiaceae bacterium]|nr:alpha-2-macroglobulin family protein [Polyangiaceae bacterium]